MQKYNFNFIYILVIILSATGPANAEFNEVSSWVLKIEDKGMNVAVYYRTLSSGNVEFKGVTRIHAPLNSLIALLHDVDAMPDWVYNVEHAKILKKNSATEYYVYVINSAYFPFSKRDSVVHTTIKQDPETLAVIISGQSEPNYIPESPKYVRLTLVESFWMLTPLENGNVEVVFQGLGEPGGNIIANVSHSKIFQWISKKLLWELPMVSLKNMQQEIKKDKYRNKKYDFIKDAGN